MKSVIVVCQMSWSWRPCLCEPRVRWHCWQGLVTIETPKFLVRAQSLLKTADSHRPSVVDVLKYRAIAAVSRTNIRRNICWFLSVMLCNSSSIHKIQMLCLDYLCFNYDAMTQFPENNSLLKIEFEKRYPNALVNYFGDLDMAFKRQ